MGIMVEKTEDTYRVACDERARKNASPRRAEAFCRSGITGWDASNPPEVECAYRIGFRAASERCLRIDLASAEALRDRVLERRASLCGPHPSDRRAAFLRGAAHGCMEAMRARVTGVKTGLLSWLPQVDAWASEDPPRLDWAHAQPPPLPAPEGPMMDKRDVPPWVWFDICGGPAPRPLAALRAEHAAANNVAPLCATPPTAQPGASLTPTTATRQITLTRADQIEIRPPDWLLRGALERDAFALVFGDPGCGKSFLAIDWACRVATGSPWRGHVVKAGPVVYVAGEGQHGFGRRIRAWSEHHCVGLDGVPLYLSPAVAMPDPGDIKALVTAIDTGVDSVGQRPALIVLDTLARNFGGGDENATQDMGRFVMACDAIRARYGCTILVVHHTGHADKSRARGAVALKAALDAEYRLTNEGKLLLTPTKMKEAELPPPLSMELVTVELPGLKDDFGLPVTSAAIDVLDADTAAIVAQAKASMPKPGKWQQTGLRIARRLAARNEDRTVAIDAWRVACEKEGMARQNQFRVLQSLADRGVIVVEDGSISLPNQPSVTSHCPSIGRGK
ncbi:MAG: AAA family ATPase [Actinomycetales bacterium]|nr:AAA family ATPase [Actinomycetales bacterium]